MTLSGVPADVTSIELCVIDRLRRRVASFVTVKCDADGGEVVITADGTDVGPMAAVQSEVFNTTCANCHGASNHAAAGLSLLAERAMRNSSARVRPSKQNQCVSWPEILTKVCFGKSFRPTRVRRGAMTTRSRSSRQSGSTSCATG